MARPFQLLGSQDDLIDAPLDRTDLIGPQVLLRNRLRDLAVPASQERSRDRGGGDLRFRRILAVACGDRGGELILPARAIVELRPLDAIGRGADPDSSGP